MNILNKTRLVHVAETPGTEVNASLLPLIHVVANGAGSNRRKRADCSEKKG